MAALPEREGWLNPEDEDDLIDLPGEPTDVEVEVSYTYRTGLLGQIDG